MNRTQIYLPNSQQIALREEARRSNSTISEVIRGLIHKELQRQAKGRQKFVEPATPTLLEVAEEIKKLGEKLRVKGPEDLSTNLDAYLYGGKQ